MTVVYAKKIADDIGISSTTSFFRLCAKKLHHRQLGDSDGGLDLPVALPVGGVIPVVLLDHRRDLAERLLVVTGVRFQNQMGVWLIERGFIHHPMESDRITCLQVVAGNLLIFSRLAQFVELRNMIQTVLAFGTCLGRHRMLRTRSLGRELPSPGNRRLHHTGSQRREGDIEPWG